MIEIGKGAVILEAHEVRAIVVLLDDVAQAWMGKHRSATKVLGVREAARQLTRIDVSNMTEGFGR